MQVEHPVTEWISGVNIPACQVMIGMGLPLSAIPEVRMLYGRDPTGTDTIDFHNTPQVRRCVDSLKNERNLLRML